MISPWYSDAPLSGVGGVRVQCALVERKKGDKRKGERDAYAVL
jgi:hypothetical protein